MKGFLFMNKDNSILVYGATVDQETRCIHYHTRKDIIAIKFRCCQKYYPCYQCHNESENHAIRVWKKQEYEESVVLCGVCRHQFSITDYITKGQCPQCRSTFNSNCSRHFQLYFEM